MGEYSCTKFSTKFSSSHHVNACSCASILQVLGSFIQERQDEGARRSIDYTYTNYDITHGALRVKVMTT